MQFRLVLLLVVTVLLTLAPALAANPGHPASSVSSGTFESGNYTFPDSMFVMNYVGIGTSSPTQLLDINGSVNVSSASGILYVPQICLAGDCISSWSGVTGTATNLTVAGDTGSTEFTDGETLTLDGQNSIVTAVSGSTATIDVVDDSINGSELADTIALDANLSFSQGTYDVNFDSNTLFIDGSANRVAVGTTSPAYSFHVFGTGIISQNTGGASVIRTDRTDGKIAALVSASSSSLFAFDETGDFSIQSYSRSTIEGTSFTSPSLFVLKGSSDFIGVNTSNPSYTFDVAGTINAGNQLCIGAACISSWADVNTSVPDESSIEGYIFDTDNTFSGNFSLNTNDLFLDSSKGYLGIGTTVPSQQLEVSNSTQSFTFNPGGYNNSPQINTTVGTDLVLSSGSGNVVIVIG